MSFLDKFRKFTTGTPLRTLISLLTIALLIPVTLFATIQNLEVRRRAAEPTDPITVVNNQLQKKAEEYKTASPATESEILEELTTLASQRKDLLLQKIKTNPEFFLSHTLPKNVRDQLPQDLKDKGLIEQDVEIQGPITIWHFDDFENKKSRTEYKVKSAEGEYNLHFTNSPPELSSGSKILIKGMALDFEVAVDLSKETNIQVQTTPTIRTTGDFRMGVLMFNFSNDPFHREPWTREEIEAVVFGNESSTRQFYEEVSYQQTFFSGGVSGWLDLTQETTYCDPRGWAGEAISLSGINPEDYDRIAYLFPYVWRCEWGGLAIMGGKEIWVNGMNLQEIPDSGTFIHELGHTFNLHHSNLITCGGKAIDVYSNCQVEEYWDRYDEMGLQKHHFNAAHKIKLKWIEPPNITDVFQSGEYVLHNFETPPSGPQVLRIRKPDTRHFYYIEYRRPLGFDASLPERIQNSSLVHLGGLVDGEISGLRGTFLIDTTPSNHINADESLVEGISFYDEINQITISQLDHNNDYATISITLPPSMTSTCPENVNQNPNLGKAAYFNEHTYLEVPSPNTLRANANEDFTIEVWIKPELKDKYEGMSFLTHRKVPDIAGQVYSLFLGTPPGENPSNIRFRFGEVGPEGGWVQSDFIIPLGSWTHVAGVKEGSNLKIFINGDLVGSRPFIGIADMVEAVNYIGGWVVSYQLEPIYAYKGSVDELRVSNIARDIQSNWQNGVYNNPLVIDEHTLARWRFEENMLDSTQNGNHATAHGNICFGEGRVGPSSPDFGKALKFDYDRIFGIGSAHVEVGSSDKLLMGDEFSIEAWIKPDEELINPPGNDPQNPRFILAKEGIPDEAWGYSLDVASRKVEFGVNLKKNDGTRVREMLFGQTELEKDRWYFVQAIKSGNDLNLYLNGRLEDRKMIEAGAVEKEVTPLTIGCAKMKNFPPCLSNFYGEIDEIRISNVARSVGVPIAPFSADEHTIALWHLDQNTLDATSNDLDGRILGDLLYVSSTVGIVEGPPVCIPGSLLDGDTDCDCRVNIFDLIRVGINYGKRKDDPNWDPLADVVADGEVNIFDLVKVGANFGRTCPSPSPLW